jgi:hypothetical protein
MNIKAVETREVRNFELMLRCFRHSYKSLWICYERVFLEIEAVSLLQYEFSARSALAYVTMYLEIGHVRGTSEWPIRGQAREGLRKTKKTRIYINR